VISDNGCQFIFNCKFCCSNPTRALLVCGLHRSNKQECPAKIFVSGTTQANVLVVQKVHAEHTCSVSEHYFSYPGIRCNISEEALATVSTLANFDVSASEVAMYLREKGHSTITLKDISNLRARIKQQNARKPDTENEVVYTYVLSCIVTYRG